MLKLKNDIEKFVNDFYNRYGKMMSNLANEKNCISMTIHYEIEYQTPQEQYDILEVDLLGDVTENAIIEKHVQENFQKIEKEFIKKYNATYD